MPIYIQFERNFENENVIRKCCTDYSPSTIANYSIQIHNYYVSFKYI